LRCAQADHSSDEEESPNGECQEILDVPATRRKRSGDELRGQPGRGDAEIQEDAKADNPCLDRIHGQDLCGREPVTDASPVA